MEFEIDKRPLLEALKAVAPGVATRSYLPVLTGVRLEAAYGRLDLETTDLAVCIRIRVPASTAPGYPVANPAVVLPAKALTKAVSVMRGEVLTLKSLEDEGRLRVQISSSEGSSIVLDSYQPEVWTSIAIGARWAPAGSFDAKELTEALSRISLCATEDETRPVLTGVQFAFQPDAGIVELVATDSHRLGVIRLQMRFFEFPLPVTRLFPARVMKALARQLTGHSGRVELYLGATEEATGSPRYADFSYGRRSWVVREIEGEFPDWQRLIPVKEAASFEYDAKELAGAIKTAVSLRSSRGVPVRIALNDSPTLSLVEDDVVTVAERLEKASYFPNGTGDIDIALDPDYVSDAIRVVGGERGLVWVQDVCKPALFLSPETQDRRYLLMPVRPR